MTDRVVLSGWSDNPDERLVAEVCDGDRWPVECHGLIWVGEEERDADGTWDSDHEAPHMLLTKKQALALIALLADMVSSEAVR